nr:MAG TPA: hypothetical protein [Caudoviricetes sp.]
MPHFSSTATPMFLPKSKQRPSAWLSILKNVPFV